MEVGEENNEKRLVKIIYFSPKKYICISTK